MNNKIYILALLKNWLCIFVVLAIVLELIFFPSLANSFGCGMAFISYLIFSYFLKEKYILLFPFSFLMYLSMFLYRYLPLIATVAEGKPISYGFERPYQTFIYESILFIFSSLAFWGACSLSEKPRNNVIQRVLFKLNFFESNVSIIWGLGIVGFLVRIYTFNSGGADFGDVGGKFLDGLKYLQFAPIILLFPNLVRLKKYSKIKWVWGYLIIIFIIGIASNSRNALITPIAIYILLFFFKIVKLNISPKSLISPSKVIMLVLFLFFGLNALSDLSLAMLSSRSIRSDVSKMELFEQTIKVYQDDVYMEQLKSIKEGSLKKVNSYAEGWTEDYLDNFMLNRYANLRITDETLYYAEKLGYSDNMMKQDLIRSLFHLLPIPILKIFGMDANKELYTYSRGDLLSGRGLGFYRVTSHVGDGLATFGYLYFFIQFIAFFLVFKLLNSLVYFLGSEIIYSPFGLMNVFVFLGMFRNANGMSSGLGFCVRYFWQGCVTYIIVFLIVKLIVNMFIRR